MIKIYTTFSLIVFLLSCQISLASNDKTMPSKSYSIKLIGNKIEVDGVLDESVWQNLPKAQNFFECFPNDSNICKVRTLVKMCYDKKNIYLGVTCYDKIKDGYVAQSLKRDFSYPANDAFGIYLCPQNDKTNGFNFTVSPLGVQREGILTNGGNYGVTTSWDNKWFSEVKNYPDSYTIEIAIPFKSIRYNHNIKEWGINFSRQDLHQNINSAWNPIPKIFNVATLAYTGKLLWEDDIPKAGVNLVAIPYISFNRYLNHQKPEQNYNKPNLGADFKIGVTSSLNLDITLNPDFAQAEVDEQVPNLDRFEIFFPERRNFFIENSDLFANFGFSRIRPFFSRRIGLNRETKEIVPISSGVRLSGKVNKNWRIGAMNIQTSIDTFQSFIGNNYSTLALQRQIGVASNLSFIGVNRQVIGNVLSENSPYNRLLGLDYNFATRDNKYIGKVFLHHTISPVNNKGAFSHASYVNYTTSKLHGVWNHEYVAKNYNAEMGYVPRMAYWRLEPWIGYYFFPKESFIWRHGPEIYSSFYTDLSYKPTDYRNTITYKLTTKQHFDFNITANNNYIYLFTDFDPTGKNNPKLSANTGYHFNYATTYFGTDFRKKWREELSIRVGEYYNGKGYAIKNTFSYRFPPYMILSIVYDRNTNTLPHLDNQPVSLHLISTKVELTLNRNLFLTSFLQINDQLERVNLNARLQWRFKPMSDFYIVYNRNFDSYGGLYFPMDDTQPLLRRWMPESKGFSPFNQSLILKCTWWLNI